MLARWTQVLTTPIPEYVVKAAVTLSFLLPLLLRRSKVAAVILIGVLCVLFPAAILLTNLFAPRVVRPAQRVSDGASGLAFLYVAVFFAAAKPERLHVFSDGLAVGIVACLVYGLLGVFFVLFALERDDRVRP